jgi:hypothetical protein
MTYGIFLMPLLALAALIFISSSFLRRREKFVWNEFGQPEVGPKGRIERCILQSSQSLCSWLEQLSRVLIL